MILSRRERYIAAVTIAAVVILLLDRFALTPALASRTATDKQIQSLQDNLSRGQMIISRQRQLSAKWEQMLANGLTLDPAAAQAQVMTAVNTYATEAGLSLSSVRPERVSTVGDLGEAPFEASGTGPMSAVANFLWRLENSPLPIRIRDLQLGTRKEGADDLSLQLGLSALCQAPSVEAKPGKTAAAAKTKEDINE